MPDTIRQAIAGSIVDTSKKLTPEVIKQVAALGFEGIVRYVPLPGVDPALDIDVDELRAIMDTGLATMLVQHVRFANWNPGVEDGTVDARVASDHARGAGYLPGGHIFLDLEGIQGTAQDTKRFAETWAAAIVQAGYCAGCYVGFGVPLNAVQLYNLHDFHCYWSDAGPRAVATRGFAIKQHAPEIRIAGIEFDRNTVSPDKLGDFPFWMTALAADQAELVA